MSYINLQLIETVTDPVSEVAEENKYWQVVTKHWEYSPVGFRLKICAIIGFYAWLHYFKRLVDMLFLRW